MLPINITPPPARAKEKMWKKSGGRKSSPCGNAWAFPLCFALFLQAASTIMLQTTHGGRGRTQFAKCRMKGLK